jgi:hypothetical protein
MKMTTSSWKQVVGLLTLAAGLTGAARAQEAPIATSFGQPVQSMDDTGGLLGQTYAGGRFSYTFHSDSAPGILHRYGFISSRPMTDGLDAAFTYDYQTASNAGLADRWHDVRAPFTGYLTTFNGTIRPYVAAAPGWRWQKINGVTDNGFTYLAGTGAEFKLSSRFAVTPYANYEAAPSLHEHGWEYGTTTSYRLNRAWSGLLGGEIDERHNLTYTLGVNRHF